LEHPSALAKEVIVTDKTSSKTIKNWTRKHAAVYDMLGALEWKFYKI
jgi:hypothetical protein